MVQSIFQNKNTNKMNFFSYNYALLQFLKQRFLEVVNKMSAMLNYAFLCTFFWYLAVFISNILFGVYWWNLFLHFRTNIVKKFLILSPKHSDVRICCYLNNPLFSTSVENVTKLYFTEKNQKRFSVMSVEKVFTVRV